MKATINNNGKEVVIELTSEQEAYVKAQSENIMDRVKTFEDAWHIGNDADPRHWWTPLAKLELIISVLNEGWKPDWGDATQEKYLPWFEYTKDGFICKGIRYSYQYTLITSRLCFKSNKLAEYAATQFQSLYNTYLQ